jgi:hypothetical protein
MTRAVAQGSLHNALDGVRRDGERWPSEVMPTGEQIKQRIAVAGASFKAALDARARQRLLHMNTLSRSVLMAMTAWPTTTPTNDTMRMMSMARSRVAGVAASTSAGVGNSAATAMTQR